MDHNRARRKIIVMHTQTTSYATFWMSQTLDFPDSPVGVHVESELTCARRKDETDAHLAIENTYFWMRHTLLLSSDSLCHIYVQSDMKCC